MLSITDAIPEIVDPPDLRGVTPNTTETQEEAQDEPANIQQRNSSTDSVRAFLKEIGRVPMLTREEELTEARKVQRYMQLLGTQDDNTFNPENNRIIQEGERAKTHMIQANLRLVVCVAKKYANRGLDLMDLIQEGSLGLGRGVEKFDPTKGYRFSTYSYWWIRQSITRAIAEKGRTIRLPIHITEKLNALKKAQREISQIQGRTATIDELAIAIESTPAMIRKLLEQTRQPMSLDMKVGSEQKTELAELIESQVQSPEELMNQILLKDTVDNLLSGLESRERLVIELRYGITGEEMQSLAEVGRVLQLSRERVRQIEAKALRKLRRPGAQEQLQSFLEED